MALTNRRELGCYPHTFSAASRPWRAAMIIPIRCFSCGKVTGNKWQAYLNLTASGVSEKEALTTLGLKRYCCRRMLLCHVDRSGAILNYDSFEDPHPPSVIFKKRKRPQDCVGILDPENCSTVLAKSVDEDVSKSAAVAVQEAMNRGAK